VTGAPNGTGGCGPPLHELVVVHVSDAINPTLAGRGGASYQSPPQPREEALMLVRLLLGSPNAPLDGKTQWRCPVAGGTRTVTLAAAGLSASQDGDPARHAPAAAPLDAGR
jgi:hypothetical protein